MIDRRLFLGALSAEALLCSSSVLAAGRPKNPCNGARSAPTSPSSDWMPAQSARFQLGVGGSYRHAGEAMAAIHRDFQATMEYNFARMTRPAINALFGAMTADELSCLCRSYATAALNSGRHQTLLDIITAALDDRQLKRLVAAAGFEQVYASVLKSAPDRAASVISALHLSPGLVRPQAGGFNENPLDYTIKEIYLSYRTAPRGSFSVPAAMYETATYAGTRLLGAFTFGYSVGTAIQKTWESYSPSSWSTFSNYLGSSIDTFAGSVSSIIGSTPFSSITDTMNRQVGTLQEGLWSEFRDAGPVSWYLNGGDFGVTSSWQFKASDMACK